MCIYFLNIFILIKVSSINNLMKASQEMCIYTLLTARLSLLVLYVLICGFEFTSGFT